MKLKLIQQGAEAKILLDSSKNLIIKDRISKSYRHPNLDAQIRKRRTKSETKLLEKASKIIDCPAPTHTTNIYQIPMPFINGKKLSEHFNQFSLEKQKEICKEIGNSVAKLHKENIIHGDLTTSNMILVEDDSIKENKLKKLNSLTISKKSDERSEEHLSGAEGRDNHKIQNKIFFIDFGLGYISSKTEDKAVDLHLLKHALEAKHFKNNEILIKEIFNSYEKISGEIEFKKVFERMKAIEKRGRYRH
ncbi:MAG TPA: RIO1 family regulatory kinase/ATPase [Candidatus Nanoarchaeia archaeon]|nr:RIO1 family regulatory kinase/ATPase [Candidatus Nanoarchaeia archaeon]